MSNRSRSALLCRSTLYVGVPVILLFILVWGMFAGWLANIILGGGSRSKDCGPLLVAAFSASSTAISFRGAMVR